MKPPTVPARSRLWLRQLLLAALLCCCCCWCPADAAAEIVESLDGSGGRGTGTLDLDRSFLFRFDCPTAHSGTFAAVYLPRVRCHVNASLDRLQRQHGLGRCSGGGHGGGGAAVIRSHQSCLTVAETAHVGGGSDGDDAYEIAVQLHGRSGQVERAAFAEAAAAARDAIEAIAGIRECARINVTAWARDDVACDTGCQPGGGLGPAAASAAVAVTVVVLALVALAAVHLTRHQRKQQRRGQRQVDEESPQAKESQGDAEDEQPQPQPQPQPQIELRPQRPVRHLIIGPLPQSPSAAVSSSSGGIIGGELGWLNLAYRPDTPGQQLLPSRLVRFRGADPATFVDSGEARRQFARLGDVGGDHDAFYRVAGGGEADGSPAFVLATSAAPVERLLELLWACGGVGLSLDAGLADRLASAPTGGRFHLTGWETRSFPCYGVATATMHCLDSNLTKRLRVCHFAGRWDAAAEAPASRAEFVRFARACADALPAAVPPGGAPAAASLAASGPSCASLLPAFLMAAEQVRRASSCDLLRLAARLRRQCPAAVASLQHYLFLTHCLHAYAFLLKRNSI